VAEKRTFMALLVRTVQRDLRATYGLSEIAHFMPRSQMLWSLLKHIGQNRGQQSVANQFSAASCKRTSENSPSAHSGE